MNRRTIGPKPSSRRQQLPHGGGAEMFETETGPQSYLELMSQELAREKMSRRPHQSAISHLLEA